MKLSTTVKGFANRTVSATSFGLIPLFSIPVLAEGMRLPSMLCYRFAFGCLGLLAVLLWKRVPLGIRWKEAGEIAVLALFYDTEALLMILGYNYMPSGVATTLVFSYPIWTELLMLLFFHEKFSWTTMTAMLLAFGGVAFFSGFGSGGNIQPMGIAIELLAGLSYAFYMVSMSNMRVRRMNDLKLTFYVFAFGLFFFAVFSTLFFGGIDGVKDTPMCLNLLALGLVCTALSNVTLIPAIRQIGATLTAILGAFEPLTAMVISILVFGDRMTVPILIGFALIIAAVMLLVMARMGAPHPRFWNGKRPYNTLTSIVRRLHVPVRRRLH